MTYDRSIKLFDEAHAPEKIDKILASQSINKGKFLTLAHAHSYLCQMQVIHNLRGVKRVLEVDPGEAYCANNLRNLGLCYDTLDFETTHSPTYVADFATYEPSFEHSQLYDLTCAFQVLEHMPYDMFKKNLLKLKAMSNKYVFISLPYSCRGFSVNLNIQNGQNNRWLRKFDFYLGTNLPNRRYRTEYMEEFPWAVHYWEIGRKGFKLKKVLNDIESVGLTVIKRFHSQNPYHYFILCELGENMA